MSRKTTTNIAFQLQSVAARKQGATAVVEVKSGRKVSFTRLQELSDRYAWHLRRKGVRPGERIMLMVKPSADFICLTFALFKAGAVVILIDPGMGYRNLLRCVEGVRPDGLIGIARAHLFVRLFKRYFSTIRYSFCVGNSLGVFGRDMKKCPQDTPGPFPVYVPGPDDLAAIIFTTGSTGPPKGVRYEHSIFAAQLEHIRSYYGIGENDIDQPAFPLFALFTTALGACAVIPDMDPTKPARVDPQKFVASLQRYRVTYSFGSPALWNVVSRYCLAEKIVLGRLSTVLMAGAPVSGDLLARTLAVLPEQAAVHTPYGATESLPIVSLEAHEIVAETWPLTRQGKGTCVGRPLPGIEVIIIAISDKEIPEIQKDMLCKRGQVGEILVSGDVVTRAYENNDRETRLAKSRYAGRLWHRMGDVGYLDESGRIWFCGRKAHRVVTAGETKFTICCEAIINTHPEVFRSALVGVPAGRRPQVPVLIIERVASCKKPEGLLLEEIRDLAAGSPLTADIEHYLFHDEFPVDIRHNAKIFREKLSIWAEEKLKGIL